MCAYMLACMDVMVALGIFVLQEDDHDDVDDVACRVQDAWCRVQCIVSSVACRVQDVGCTVGV